MRMIGILLDEKMFTRLTRIKSSRENLKLYNRACQENGLTPVYLCLERMNISARTAQGYQYRNGKYTKIRTKIPKVIYNRAMPATKKMRQRLTLLNKKTYVFNAKTRYSKYRIHQLLAGKFSSNLPHTKSYSKVSLQQMMKRHKQLYIKPQSGSVGDGIIKLSRQANDRWLIQKPNGKQTASAAKAATTIHRYIANKPYIVQSAIPLARYNGRPFDIRVVVQRGSGGHWRVTATVGKVARKGNYVTNAARGGSIKKTDVLFKRAFQSPALVRRSVEQLSLNAAKHLGNKIARFSDVGIDVGITSKGKPYFIEANCRDQRYGLKIVNMTQAYYRVHKTPIDYANYMFSRLR